MPKTEKCCLIQTHHDLMKEKNQISILFQRPRKSPKISARIQPQKMNQVRYFDSQDYVEGSRSIRFRYTRLVNGVPFYEDSLEAEVDRATGEVTSFSVQWGSFNFPKANPGIRLDKAYEN